MSQHKVPKEVEDIECNIEAMSREQREFYDYWLRELTKGRAVDSEANLDYIEIYIDSLRERFEVDKNLDHLFRSLDKIYDVYKYLERLGPRLDWIRCYAYLFVQNYERSWHFLLQSGYGISVSQVINIRGKCNDTAIDGEIFCRVSTKSNNGLTTFGSDNIELVRNSLSNYLNDFRRKNKKTFIEQFCQQFDFKNLTDADFLKLGEFHTNEQEFHRLKLQDKRAMNHDDHFYDGYMFREEYVPAVVAVAIENEIKRLFRECENKVREDMGLPKIGEGWISETELFYKLRKYFPDEKIVQHATPNWLARQHLDIYFPMRNVGIEYQGLQHIRPVEYFGGPDAFEKQKLRDERKKRLCDENNCELIYVFGDYSFDELTNRIEFLFKPNNEK